MARGPSGATSWTYRSKKGVDLCQAARTELLEACGRPVLNQKRLLCFRTHLCSFVSTLVLMQRLLASGVAFVVLLVVAGCGSGGGGAMPAHDTGTGGNSGANSVSSSGNLANGGNDSLASDSTSAASLAASKQVISRSATLKCLSGSHVAAHAAGPDAIEIDGVGAPRVDFATTPGQADAESFNAQAEAAEQIGNALLYPNRGSDALLAQIEHCLTTSS
jgi:hypothetical protein